jgi:tripartite ATP-independent transporter DctM subunit
VRARKKLLDDTSDYGDLASATIWDGIKAFVPFVFLIFAVMGLILGGVCAPTEAAASGALGSIVLAAAYRKCNLKTIMAAAATSLRTSAMVYFVAVGANIFTAVFFGIGCDKIVKGTIASMGLGPWGTLVAVLLIVFLLGMLIDWVGILLIVMPIFMPILNSFGFDPLWTSMMIIVMLQTSFITPPFAYALFYVKGVSPPHVTIKQIYAGVPPFIFLVLFMLLLMTIFPSVALWLPSLL